MLWFPPCSTIQGRIDQVNQLLELDYQKRGGARYTALDKWTKQLNSLNQAIVSKLTWFWLTCDNGQHWKIGRRISISCSNVSEYKPNHPVWMGWVELHSSTEMFCDLTLFPREGEILLSRRHQHSLRVSSVYFKPLVFVFHKTLVKWFKKYHCQHLFKSAVFFWWAVWVQWHTGLFVPVDWQLVLGNLFHNM